MLVLINIAAYISLVTGIVQLKRRSSQHPADLNALFRQVSRALEKKFPDLPRGFTIREGLSRARAEGLDLHWDRIEWALEGYEAHRYGNAFLPSTSEPELGKLVRKLRSWSTRLP